MNFSRVLSRAILGALCLFVCSRLGVSSNSKVSSFSTSCTSTSSCESSTISDDIIDCLGYQSCQYSTLTGSEDVSCWGCQACKYATMSTSNSNAYLKCAGQASCNYATLSPSDGSVVKIRGCWSGVYATITASYSDVHCQSYLACSESVIISNVTDCSGEYACMNANITAYGKLVANSDHALYGAMVFNTSYIQDIGDYTFEQATISSYGLPRLDIVSQGYYSTSNSNVLCYSGSTCVIKCQGDESCTDMNVYCEDGSHCRTICTACANCPNVYNVSTIDQDILLSNILKHQSEDKIAFELEMELELAHAFNHDDNIKKITDVDFNDYQHTSLYILIGVSVICGIFVYESGKYLFCKKTKIINNNNNDAKYQYQSI